VTVRLPVAHPWFGAEDAGEGVTRLWEPHVDELLVSNVWHVMGRERDLLVDTANGVGALRPAVDVLSDGRAVIAVVTHGHFDHVGGLHEFADRRCHASDGNDVRSPWPLRLRRERFTPGTLELYSYYDVPVPDVLVHSIPEPAFDLDGWTPPGSEPTAWLHDGDVIDLGGRSFEVVWTPGHTPGSVCLWDADRGVLFTGDTLYVDARLSFDDPASATASLERLRTFPVNVAHAGHDRSIDGEEFRAAVDAALGRLAAGEYGAHVTGS
jgi:glyoxylase-like metal-dependent hydrolase (beta-lactamase superfamily II)